MTDTAHHPWTLLRSLENIHLLSEEKKQLSTLQLPTIGWIRQDSTFSVTLVWFLEEMIWLNDVLKRSFVGTITDQPRATTNIATLPLVNFSESCIMSTNFVFMCPERATVLYAFALDDLDHRHRFLRCYYSLNFPWQMNIDHVAVTCT